MPSSGMLRTLRRLLVTSNSAAMKNGVFWDVTRCGSCKNRLSASFIRVTKIGELGTLAVTSNQRTLRRNTKRLSFYETSVLTRATERNIPGDTILHNHHRENHKSYNFVPSSPILVNLTMEALCSNEKWLLTRATR
jgi:hypothetical protein